jgi:hypothetical protein
MILRFSFPSAKEEGFGYFPKSGTEKRKARVPGETLAKTAKKVSALLCP